MEIIRISKNEKNEQVVSARELHEFLEVGRDFTTWVKQRIEKYGFVENVDFTTIWSDTETGDGVEFNGSPNFMVAKGYRLDYIITTSMAKELAMVENNDKGRDARKYFIECERKLKEVSLKKDLVFAIYEGGQDALTAHKLLVEMETAPIKAELIEAKSNLGDAMTQIHNLINKGTNTTFPISDVSKLLAYQDMGEKKLFQFLRDKNYLTLGNRPSQNMIGDSKMIAITKYNKYTDENYIQARVTVKGLFWLGNVLEKAGFETIVTQDKLIEQINKLIY